MTKKSKIVLAFTGLWGIFIFANSLQTGEASTKMSDAVVFRLPDWLGWLDLDTLTILVRKFAHFSEYALLALLVCLVFYYSRQFIWRNAGNILFPCLVWAVADEFLQTFVEGRTGLVQDVLIDLGGILAGCLAIALWLWIWKRRKGKDLQRCKKYSA